MTNPVIATLGRRVRLGVVGGGARSFIGAVHRSAARLDDRYEIAAGVLSSDPQRSRAEGAAAGLPESRAYGTLEEMLNAEARRDDPIDAVAIMTPNHRHHPDCTAVIERGLHVICDKPLALSHAEAADIAARVRDAGVVFCLTHNYSGYPMVRQARAMVKAGELGDIRQVRVEYVQGGLSSFVDADPPPRLAWRLDRARGGPSAVLGDIGTHAHQLVRFVTGLEVSRIAADVGATVPGRTADDYAAMLLRFDNGARGSLWVTQAASGAENLLSLKVYGSRGGLEWEQNAPNHLKHTAQGEPARTLSRGLPGLSLAAKRATRIPPGHPEGFHEAFANVYADAAEAIAACMSGTAADPLALDFPTVDDGVAGMSFVEAAIASSRSGGGWVDCPGAATAEDSA